MSELERKSRAVFVSMLCGECNSLGVACGNSAFSAGVLSCSVCSADVFWVCKDYVARSFTGQYKRTTKHKVWTEAGVLPFPSPIGPAPHLAMVLTRSLQLADTTPFEIATALIGWRDFDGHPVFVFIPFQELKTKRMKVKKLMSLFLDGGAEVPIEHTHFKRLVQSLAEAGLQSIAKPDAIESVQTINAKSFCIWTWEPFSIL